MRFRRPSPRFRVASPRGSKAPLRFRDGEVCFCAVRDHFRLREVHFFVAPDHFWVGEMHFFAAWNQVSRWMDAALRRRAPLLSSRDALLRGKKALLPARAPPTGASRA